MIFTLTCGCSLVDGDPPLRTYCDEHGRAPLPRATFTESQATKDLPRGAFYGDEERAKEEPQGRRRRSHEPR